MADLIADAELIGGSGAGTVTVADTSGYGRETDEPNLYGATDHTAWFKWVAPVTASGQYFSTVGSNYDTVLGIFEQTGSDPVSFSQLSLIAKDDQSGGANTSALYASVAAGHVYYIQVGSYTSGDFGMLKLNFPAGVAGSGGSVDLAASGAPYAVVSGSLIAEAVGALHASPVVARATVAGGLDADADGPHGLRARVVAKATVTPDVTVVRHRTLLLLVTTGRSVDNSLEVELESHLGKNARLELEPDPTRTSTASFA